MHSRYQWGLLACACLLTTACSGTFSVVTHSKTSDQGSQTTQPQAKVLAPAVVAAHQAPVVQSLPITRLIGPDHSVLAIRAKLPAVWAKLATVLAKTPYSVLDQDNELHTYFIVDKVKTGGVLKRSTPIYQLELSYHQGVTQLHLVNTRHQPVAPSVANRVMQSIQTHYTKS